MTETTIKATLIEYMRIGTSTNGNPRFDLHFDDGVTRRTQSDGSISYSVRNFDRYLRNTPDGVPVTLTLTRAGRVSIMRLADGTIP